MLKMNNYLASSPAQSNPLGSNPHGPNSEWLSDYRDVLINPAAMQQQPVQNWLTDNRSAMTGGAAPSAPVTMPTPYEQWMANYRNIHFNPEQSSQQYLGWSPQNYLMGSGGY